MPASPRLYSLVTKHWPRIAAGLVVVIGLVDFVVGGLAADSRIEFYVFAWATTTAGLWFLFQRAEESLSDESHQRVADWAREADLRPALESIPDQFALLFDRVFGERHIAWRCFWRSAVATVFALVVVSAVLYVHYPDDVDSLIAALDDPDVPKSAVYAVLLGMIVFGPLTNVIPDYLSLLETRWAIGRMERGSRMATVLAFDLVATTTISVLGIYAALIVATSFPSVRGYVIFVEGWPGVWQGGPVPSVFETGWGLMKLDGSYSLYTAYFYSAFLTSVWLWLYAASVLVSRVLLRMNSGVGFLLRVTDVEKQPFRSMGFVSVIIVSGLFALGLPFVLL